MLTNISDLYVVAFLYLRSPVKMINWFDPFVAKVFSHPDNALNLRTLPNHTSRKRKRRKGRIMTITKFIPLHEKFLQFDWLRAMVVKLNLKHLQMARVSLCESSVLPDVFNKNVISISVKSKR